MRSFGFSTGRSAVRASSAAHVHDDVELSLLVAGSATLLCHGRRSLVMAGDILVLWAGHPHQVVEASPGTTVALVNLPLNDFLGMDLPWSLNRRVLAGGPVHDPAPDDPVAELRAFARWAALSAAGDAEALRIARLEIEARLRRVARALDIGTRRDRRAAAAPSVGRQQAEHMMAFMCSHYRERCTLPQVAAAGLNRTYAAGVFRREVGMSAMEFLTRQRLAHARRWLVDGRRSVTAVASLYGFGSTVRFQAAFRAYLGMTPSAARRPGG